MTNRRRSATTRSVPAQTPEQPLELTQEHIRPLIPLIDRLNEAGAEDELKVISRQLTRLSFRRSRSPAVSSPKSRWATPPGGPTVLSLRAFHHSTKIGSRIDLIDDLEVGENLPRRKLFDFLLVQTVEPIKERPLVRRQFRMLSRARHGDSTCFG
jgi:hypothetical protein